MKRKKKTTPTAVALGQFRTLMENNGHALRRIEKSVELLVNLIQLLDAKTIAANNLAADFGRLQDAIKGIKDAKP